MTAHAIPEAWPLLMTKSQLAAYLGGMDPRTVDKICPISPVKLGAGILRWPRLQIDAWVATLPPLLLDDRSPINTVVPAGIDLAQIDRRAEALRRAEAYPGKRACKTIP